MLLFQVLLLQILVVAHELGQILRVKRHLTDLLIVSAHLGTDTAGLLKLQLLYLLLLDEELVFEVGDGVGLLFEVGEQLVELQLILLSLLLGRMIGKLQ